MTHDHTDPTLAAMMAERMARMLLEITETTLTHARELDELRKSAEEGRPGSMRPIHLVGGHSAPNNEVTRFIEANCVRDPDAWTPADRLVDAFNESSDTRRKQPMTRAEFGRCLAKVRPRVQRSRRRYTGTLRYVYEGVRLIDQRPEENPETCQHGRNGGD